MNRVRRQGFSIIELLVVISVSSSLMVLISFWLLQTFQFSRKMENRRSQHVQLTRLSRQLRADIHRASEVQEVSNDSLSIRSGNRTINYEIKRDQIERLEIDAGFRRSEVYRLQANSLAKFEMATNELVELTVYRPQAIMPKLANEIPEDWPVDLHVIASPRSYGRWAWLESALTNSNREEDSDE